MNNVRLSDDIRSALNVGTTLTTRFWLAMAMTLHGAGFFFNQGSWLMSPSFQAMNKVIPLETWGTFYLTAGALGMWRALSPRSLPLMGWIVNSLIFSVWLTTMMVRTWNGGNVNVYSLLSFYTAFLMMAGWCLIRTEATYRDTETA